MKFKMPTFGHIRFRSRAPEVPRNRQKGPTVSPLCID